MPADETTDVAAQGFEQTLELEVQRRQGRILAVAQVESSTPHCLSTTQRRIVSWVQTRQPNPAYHGGVRVGVRTSMVESVVCEAVLG